jgi:hypothetical protein
MPMPAITEVPARCRRASLVAVALLGLAVSIGTAQSQTAQPPAAEPPPAALAPEPPASQPPPAAPSPGGGGFIDKLGDWLRESAEGVSSGLKGTQQRIDDINKGTLDTLSRIPVAGLASGRALCPRAANGAPDCYAATDKLCKDKGYTAGRSLDTESSETCNPRIYLPGYQRKEGDCRIDTFVIRAACQ